MLKLRVEKNMPGSSKKRPRRLSDVVTKRKRKQKKLQMVSGAILKSANMKPNYEGLTYKEALNKRSILQKAAKSYNTYLAGSKYTSNKLNWCKTIGTKVEEMIKDKVQKWSDEAIKGLIKSKITGYKKPPAKTRQPKTDRKKGQRKPRVSKPYVRKNPNGPGLSEERREALKAAAEAWRKMTPDERAAHKAAKEAAKLAKRKRPPREPLKVKLRAYGEGAYMMVGGPPAKRKKATPAVQIVAPVVAEGKGRYAPDGRLLSAKSTGSVFDFK